MPVQGLVRLRKHQFGRQALAGTKVAATRAYPATGVPSRRPRLDRPRGRHRDPSTRPRRPSARPRRLTADLTYNGARPTTT